MIKSSIVSGALLAAFLAAGDATAATPASGTGGGPDATPAFPLLAQGGGGGGGSGGGSGGGGDSVGRGSDTSKGAVPDNPKPYPSGIESPGTAPVPPTRPAEPGKGPGAQNPPASGQGTRESQPGGSR